MYSYRMDNGEFKIETHVQDLIDTAWSIPEFHFLFGALDSAYSRGLGQIEESYLEYGNPDSIVSAPETQYTLSDKSIRILSRKRYYAPSKFENQFDIDSHLRYRNLFPPSKDILGKINNQLHGALPITAIKRIAILPVLMTAYANGLTRTSDRWVKKGPKPKSKFEGIERYYKARQEYIDDSTGITRRKLLAEQQREKPAFLNRFKLKPSHFVNEAQKLIRYQMKYTQDEESIRSQNEYKKPRMPNMRTILERDLVLVNQFLVFMSLFDAWKTVNLTISFLIFEKETGLLSLFFGIDAIARVLDKITINGGVNNLNDDPAKQVIRSYLKKRMSTSDILRTFVCHEESMDDEGELCDGGGTNQGKGDGAIEDELTDIALCHLFTIKYTLYFKLICEMVWFEFGVIQSLRVALYDMPFFSALESLHMKKAAGSGVVIVSGKGGVQYRNQAVGMSYADALRADKCAHCGKRPQNEQEHCPEWSKCYKRSYDRDWHAREASRAKSKYASGNSDLADEAVCYLEYRILINEDRAYLNSLEKSLHKVPYFFLYCHEISCQVCRQKQHSLRYNI